MNLPRLTLTGALLWTLGATAADWPEFLGPNHNGTSPETGLVDKFPTNGLPVIWERSVGAGYSAPSVRGNSLVFFHRVGDEEIVQAVDAATGRDLWKQSTPSAYQDPYGYNNGPRCTPLLDATSCYTFGAEGKLSCLKLADGKTIWQRDTAHDWNIPPAFFGVGSTPILENGRLIVMVGGQPNSGVVALDARTGKTIWESVGQKNWQGQPTGWPRWPEVIWHDSEKQASYSSPVAATIHGRRHLLCLTRQGLVSVNPTNGEVNFSFWFRSMANDSVNAMNPVVQDDLILISGAYYKVGSVLLRVKPDGKAVETVWTGDALEQHWATPILDQGALYASSGRNEPDARLRCVDFKTGKLLWDRDQSWPLHAGHSSPQPTVYGRGSIIMADGKLFVLGEGGLLGLFKPNSKMPEEISRWQVPSLHFACWAGPVLAQKRLYLRSEDKLVCLNLARD